MGRALFGADLTQDNLFDFLVRQGVCLLTLVVHITLFWGEQNPFLLALATSHALFYPIALARWKKTRQKTRLALSLDTAIYGLYQGLWGFNPLLIAIYVSCANVINMASGGTQYCIKTLLFFITGMLLGALSQGFYFRPDVHYTTVLTIASGLFFFLTAFGLRVYHINTRLRQTRNHLHQQKEDLASINHLAAAVNSHLEINILLEKIMHTIERIYPFEALYILSFDEDSEVAEVAGIFGSTITLAEYASFQTLEFDMERDKNSLFVRSLINRKVAYIPEITPELISMAAYIDKQLFTVKPSVSLVYFPVYVKDRVVAGACFINYAKHFYLEQHDLDKIQDFLVQVGTAIRNATLFKELNNAKDEAEQARKKAEASEEAKSRFLANMSHEIRTPLTAVMGYAEALQEDDISEDEREKFIGYILRSGKHLLSMISDILDISKIEACKIEVERIAFNYNDILYDIDSYLRIKCKEKSLSYTLDVHYPIPKTVVTDPTRLKQILFNLCNNAIKFTNDGSISISINTTMDSTLELRVADTGIGISQDEQHKIFSAFDQADSSTTRLFGGTGLGLYISKSLAELLGGQLIVDSVKGVGSTFTLQLPFTYDERKSLKSQAEFNALMDEIKESKSTDGIPQLHGHVLLAEDNEDNQKLICRLVKLTGLQIDAVDNGQKAIEAVQKKHYNLILMDMQMPIMGGKEASKQIKQSGHNMPIVAFTANVMKHQMDEYEELGFIDVLEKPIIRQKLFSTLEKVLRIEAHSIVNKVLIVEDNEVNQMILFRYVNKANPHAEITTTANGKEALSAAQETKFDLVLMDMEMPVMGGLEATEKLRARGETMPIYIVTGNTGKETEERCLNAGASGHITKPLDKQRILKLISSALSQRQILQRSS